MYTLKPFNSFNLDVNATAFTKIDSVAKLKKTIKNNHLPIFILGGGSNVLFTQDLHAHVCHNQIKGIKIVKDTKSLAYVEIGAGEVWHDLVRWAITHGLGGIENLSLIPGSVGAAPIQNIGAYGVELKDVFHELKAISLRTFKEVIVDKKTCNFSYRHSIFKQALKGELFITSVVLKLTKRPRLNLEYGAIKQELELMKISKPTIKEVSDVIIKIRSSKLPDPKEIGNAGSFFKNPVIQIDQFNKLKNSFPKIPHYVVSKNLVKIPAAWLIDQCGWKGKQIGQTGCYRNQPLVIVNHGQATGAEILKHALNVKKSVYSKFSILIENEVNII